jgi:hypothetical protein
MIVAVSLTTFIEKEEALLCDTDEMRVRLGVSGVLRGIYRSLKER